MQAAIAAAQDAADAAEDARAKAYKREAGQLSEKIVQHSGRVFPFFSVIFNRKMPFFVHSNKT